MSVKFSKDHEWVSVTGDIATIGITNHAQEQLGDVVFAELPEIGTNVTKGDGCAVVESTKAASDVYAPLTGVITAINQDIVDNPALVNESAQDKAWFFKIEILPDTDMDGLMNSDEYSALIA